MELVGIDTHIAEYCCQRSSQFTAREYSLESLPATLHVLITGSRDEAVNAGTLAAELTRHSDAHSADLQATR